MTRYLLRRLVQVVPLVWAVLTLIFVMLEAAPGDASAYLVPPGASAEVRDSLRERWNLDDPAPARYVALLSNMARGDLGHSVLRGRPVGQLVREALPPTLLLAATSLAFTLLQGGALGILQAVRRGTPLDGAATGLSLIVYSIPAFWLSILLVLVFAHAWPVLPATQMADPMADYMAPLPRLWDRITHLVLPALALGLANTAVVARHLRERMVRVLGRDFIRAARAKGLGRWTVVLRHALPNSLLPVLTLLGLSLPFLVSGSVIVERIFAWPGMGSLVVESILGQDTPVVLGCMLVYALMVVMGSAAADLLCAWADPRIRLEER